MPKIIRKWIFAQKQRVYSFIFSEYVDNSEINECLKLPH